MTVLTYGLDNCSIILQARDHVDPVVFSAALDNLSASDIGVCSVIE